MNNLSLTYTTHGEGSEPSQGSKISDTDIAIIAMSCRFPGADNVEAFWQNLKNGVESISFFSDDELLASGVEPEMVKNPHYVKAKGILSDIEHFDASFFGYSPREAELIDPQHRLFLEESWKTLERAGYNTETYRGLIGVYAGVDMNTYLLNNLVHQREHLQIAADFFPLLLGNDKDYLATRVSYKLNLKGPSMTVQSACSTSLVATHLACQSLLNGECDLALAGGVTLHVPQKSGYLYQEGMILSSDGHCRAFDANASGLVYGSGVGAILLKRLADAIADGDHIHAVIKGSAINNDGSLKVAFTAPSVDGRATVIAEAQAIAGIDADTITYVEAHGTGTPLGDAIEIAAMTKAFRNHTKKKGFCAVGAVRTNIGHLESAAGIAGVIKTVLSMEHQQIPPSLNFTVSNPQIDFANSPFYVNTTLSAWNPGGCPRRAGINAFGIGGTNAHVILEEAPPQEPSGDSRPAQLLVLSAKTASALDAAANNLAEYMRQHPNLTLADAAYTLQIGRRRFPHRRVVVCRSLSEAAAALTTQDPKRVLTNVQDAEERPAAFMFSGQGAQSVNMGRGLYETEPTFRAAVDECCEILKPLMGIDLRNLLYPSQDQAANAAAQLQQTAIAQPAMFVIEYAIAQLLMEWGIRPHAAIGYSVGEYAAACLAGVFSLEDALALVTTRGQLIQSVPAGTMLSVPLTEKEVHPYLSSDLSLAAVNTPNQCVVSGPTDLVEGLQRQLAEQGIQGVRLQTSHAFHSAMMDQILKPFGRRVKTVTLHPPKILWVSTVTGTWITAAEATDHAYWVKNLRQTVRFADGVRQLLTDSALILLEVGPGQSLNAFAAQHPEKSADQLILTSLSHSQERLSDTDCILTVLGRLWLEGVHIDWTRFSAHERRHRVPLPTYPFERKRYWIEPQKQARVSQAEHQDHLLYARPDLRTAYVAPRNHIERILLALWQTFLGIEQIGIYDDFFQLGGDSLSGTQIISRLQETFRIEFPIGVLFENPTIAGVAAYIEAHVSSISQHREEGEI